MKNIIVKLSFNGSVHFGNGVLEGSADTICADSIFSAICCEYSNHSNSDGIDELVSMAKQGLLKLSDAFPYKGETLFLPKPYISINTENDGDSVKKKEFKKLRYIPVEFYDEYISGKMTTERCISILDLLSSLGHSDIQEKVCISIDEDDPQPYAVGSFSFEEDAGLWFIVSTETDETFEKLRKLIDFLSLSGIGGKRSSGFGRFQVEYADVPDELACSLNKNDGTLISLSVCLPRDDELPNVIADARYSLVKRSGFVYSFSYADTARKKNDLYVMAAGSAFSSAFCGDVYDVSSGGGHPVYRYAVPIFFSIGVKA